MLILNKIQQPKYLTLSIIRDTPLHKGDKNVKLSPIRKYTLPVFLERALLIHGNQYDYSRVTTEHVKSYTSEVPVSCKICFYHWTPSISSHINQRCGCPSCSRVNPWTLERFIQQAVQIHGNNFDYTLITPNNIQGALSYIPIICNICDYRWSPSITHHIHDKNGCPQCGGKRPWTLNFFLQKAQEIHGNKYDYSEITESMIENQRSHIPIICLQCANRWSPSITHHINSETGCPECYGNIPWTLERFVPRAIQIHGDKYDYTNITADMFHGKGSHLPMKCNTCFYYWSPTIDDHINGKSGCPDCAGKAPWTLDRFLTRAANIHGDKYDYTLINEDHIQGSQSQVPVLCKTCHNIWNPRIGNHISGKQGCKHCNRSYGELSCESYFNTNNITYKREFILDNLPRKRFDFRFFFNNKWFLLEFDGKQHFEFVPFYHGEEEFFQEKQQVDILKTRKGLEAGYHIIRIDYTQIGTIAQHIESAINGSDIVYVSNTEMYQFILNKIK